ncbi:MAG: 16S rRNA (adenine(1518)-N(6)/adenine(1519)-N(6))-dimethyltransferase [Lachnospiraceae bacterium]|nr:16S rRNA (adenine(1518)-N(6)/adenine(1519)-N(6))-dimethyltransferase [Lachnospiraceae bacterium]
MERLIEVKNTIAVLQKYGFNFSKKFGQNFLIDAHVLEKILKAADITKEDTVLEIGPGIGTLTQALAERAGHVYAVEIDDKLIPILKDTLAECDNVTVINEDIMKVDLGALAEEAGLTGFAAADAAAETSGNGGEGKILDKNAAAENPAAGSGSRPGFKVVANLPYYITTPIIMSLLEKQLPIRSITVMVQKEVADRMSASPGTKDYGALSLAVQYYCEPYLAANVPQNCFMPRPDVSSAVIHLKRYETPPVKAQDPGLMFLLIRAAFSQRRKTLVNAVKNSGELSFTREQVEEALMALDIPLTIRGEALDLKTFAALSDELGKNLRV